MLSPQELQERTLKLQEEDQRLRREQFEREGSKSVLGNVSVLVTIIAGMAALAFQLTGYFSSLKQAESAKDNLKAAQLQSDNEWDFKGVSLFVAVEDKIITCDTNGNQAQLTLFTDLFERRAESFRNAAAARASNCATQQSEAARTAAIARHEAPDVVAAAAESARYDSLRNSSAALSVTSSKEPASATTPLPTVYLQISNEGQRSQAVALQQAMRDEGYKVPGIELVSTAPAKAQVRYFYGNEAEVAGKLADLAAQTLKTDTPAIVSLQGKFKNLPSGVIEFWFPKTDLG